jgi:hypothetical protein
MWCQVNSRSLFKPRCSSQNSFRHSVNCRFFIMLFTLNEIVQWLGMTAFEIWIHLVTLLVFSILSVLKYESVISITWWSTFTPLFIADGLNCYFCMIIFIRMIKDTDLRTASIRFLSSMLYLTLLFVFKILLCQKLSKTRIISSSESMAPIFILLQLVMIRACQTSNWVVKAIFFMWIVSFIVHCIYMYVILDNV